MSLSKAARIKLLAKIELRNRLCEMQRWRCAYCLCDISQGATIDEIWPRSKHGKRDYENCVAACERCNAAKSSHFHWNFYKHIDIRRQRVYWRSQPRWQ